MSASLSPIFLADLAKLYAALRPPLLSAEFLSDLEKVFAAVPGTSGADLQFLASRFDEWRRTTKEFVRTRLAELSDDDPLCCPISLFRTMDYGRLETAHTRALAWLLDPAREHGFGTTLLAALLRRLSGGDRSDTLRVQRVQSEFQMDGSGGQGRFDVLAEGTWEEEGRGGWMLVIEAKVDAWEGKDQLLKYETWLEANSAGRDVFLAFLTPDGRAPETGAEEWEPLSFLELVRTFRAAYGGLRQTPGFHFLRFYLAGVLQDVCRWPRNIAEEGADPYAVASYLQTVRESRSEDANHDCAR